jgi:hypothetical protein
LRLAPGPAAQREQFSGQRRQAEALGVDDGDGLGRE